MNPLYVSCWKDSKAPIGNDWGKNGFDGNELAKRLAINPEMVVGLILGQATGIIDVECDGEAATAHYHELFGEVRTPSWKSKRGSHNLFQYDERLAQLGTGVIKFESGLEFRIGNDGQTQSIVPPSIVDGVRREWVVSLDECDPAPLPEHVFELLLSRQSNEKPVTSSHQRIEFLDAMDAERREAMAQKVRDYCVRHDLSIRNEHTDDLQRHYLHLAACPFKPPGHEDGDPSIMVTSSGSVKWACRHAKCQDKTWEDVEAMYGPLHPDKVTLNPAENGQSKKPRIDINHELHRMVDEATRALGNAPNTFQYGQALVQVVYDAEKPPQCLHDNGSPQLVVIPSPSLATRLSACADWWRFDTRATKDEKKWKRATPPPSVVNAVHVANNWPGVPPITGIVSCPVLRADGSLLTEPGYDRETGLYLETGELYPSLMHPDKAIELLFDVVSDFPFKSPEHRSAWLAFLITLVTRPAFAGNAPFFLFDANAPGTGKGLLTDLTTMIVEGRVACRYSWSNNNEETRKLITTVGLSGAHYLMWDNIKGTLGGPALENMMTTGIWADRELGGNRQVEFPIRFIPVGTSNNAKLSHDMIRRTCLCKQHSPLENPAERTGFRYPDLLSIAKQRRSELVMAALSIPAAYIQAGSPDQNLTEWGGYREWSDLVRGSIVWAGQPDPGETREGLKAQADDDTSVLRALMDVWPGSMSIAKVIEASASNQALQAVLEELPGDDTKQSLGTLLRGARGRNIGGRFFERTDKRPSIWSVCEAAGA